MQALLRTQKSLPASILFAPVDTRSKEWSPAFPSCRDEGTRLDPNLGYMGFPQDGHFVLSNFERIETLHCRQDINLYNQITLYDKVRNLCYHIDFEEVATKERELTYSDVLLLFAQWGESEHDFSEGRGISCITVEVNGDGLQARFLKAFRWVRHKTKCHASTGTTDLQGQTISPRYAHYRIACPIGRRFFSRKYRLILDMGNLSKLLLIGLGNILILLRCASVATVDLVAPRLLSFFGH